MREQIMKKPTVLFDLDGTLLDTAPDLAEAVNKIRRERDLPELALETLRPHAGFGSKALLKVGMNADDDHPTYPELLHEFLRNYQSCSMQSTRFFPGIEALLNTLDEKQIRWGIVTNKPERFTTPIIQQLQLDQRAACIISGDTLAQRKPHPAQITHACELLNVKPTDTFYVGDTFIDVQASTAAGTRSLVVLYGYTSEQENPYDWKAEGYLHQPSDLMNWL
jgi:2-phosphoglycolate phosphatase